MNAKQSRRNFAPRRSTSAKDVAQRREFKRNYIKISNAIDEVVGKYWGEGHRRFSKSIMALVRELTGRRITEISDDDIGTALACVHSAHHLIREFRWHMECENSRHEWQGREQKEREQRGTTSSTMMDRIVSSIRRSMGVDEMPRERPALSLVPDCGRDLALREPHSPSGPGAA